MNARSLLGLVLVLGACGGSSSPVSLSSHDASVPDDASSNNQHTDGSTTDVDGSSSSMTCSPQPIGAFSPTWKPPVAGHQNVCTTMQIAAGVTAAAGGDVSAFVSANATCAACMFGDANASMRAAIVTDSSLGLLEPNRDGCIAIVSGDLTASGCGAKEQADFDCDKQACATACPVTDQASLTAYNACANAAQQANAVCDTYSQAAGACEAALGATDAGISVCLQQSGQSINDYISAIATLFCGA